MDTNKKIIKDEVDLNSLLAVLFENLNLLISLFSVSFFVLLVYYFSSTKLYQSDSLIEVKSESSSNYLPESLSTGLPSAISSQESLTAEIEIYKSEDTIFDALNLLQDSKIIPEEVIPSLGDVRNNLVIRNKSKSLLEISYVSENEELSKALLDFLNEEYMKDRRDFVKQSSTAGRNFIQNEIPRIKTLLKEAENNLNDFKISTNTSDVIFNTNTRNLKLDDLRDRFNEIVFKELELKEFYRESHPIYLTLTEQKNLILSQINEIEKDLPNIPSTERALENLKREVEIYSNVLGELSSQDIALSMAEASSLSNVRIINYASDSYKVSPRTTLFILTIIFTLIAYLILVIRHFFGDKITHFDALIDFVGKEKIIGELPFLNLKGGIKENFFINIANELLNKTIYEITHTEDFGKSICVISSNKGAGKTEISRRLFEKLKNNYKTCLIDLDYRKKGLTKEYLIKEEYENFNVFYENKSNHENENGSLFIPSFNIDSPPDFFTSEEFKNQLKILTNDFDYIICDTPPWKLFVDAKIISSLFDNKIYVVSNQESSFRDIEIFQDEIGDSSSVRYFYNKFNLYFNFLWYKYQYPYYSRNYYQEYLDYSNIRISFTKRFFSLESLTAIYTKTVKWIKSLKIP
tara:strand:- start:1624 stop:3531 length:1908 start_codon:yes stop_codon:yes gene_type:complete